MAFAKESANDVRELLKRSKDSNRQALKLARTLDPGLVNAMVLEVIPDLIQPYAVEFFHSREYYPMSGTSCTHYSLLPVIVGMDKVIAEADRGT